MDRSDGFNYYDTEDDTYIIWLDEAEDLVISTELKIDDTEFRGGIWNCYLRVAEYDAKAQAYRCEYKVY